MAPVVPAQAADGGWKYAQAPSVQIDENFFMHQHVEGRPGNWHLLNIRVQQDDDGTMGALTDLRCPRASAGSERRRQLHGTWAAPTSTTTAGSR